MVAMAFQNPLDPMGISLNKQKNMYHPNINSYGLMEALDTLWLSAPRTSLSLDTQPHTLPTSPQRFTVCDMAMNKFF